MDITATAVALIAFKKFINNPRWWAKNTRRKKTGEIFVSSDFTYQFADMFGIPRDDVNPYFIDAALERLEPKTLTGEANDDHSSPNE